MVPVDLQDPCRFFEYLACIDLILADRIMPIHVIGFRRELSGFRDGVLALVARGDCKLLSDSGKEFLCVKKNAFPVSIAQDIARLCGLIPRPGQWYALYSQLDRAHRARNAKLGSFAKIVDAGSDDLSTGTVYNTLLDSGYLAGLPRLSKVGPYEVFVYPDDPDWCQSPHNHVMKLVGDFARAYRSTFEKGVVVAVSWGLDWDLHYRLNAKRKLSFTAYRNIFGVHVTLSGELGSPAVQVTLALPCNVGIRYSCNAGSLEAVPASIKPLLEQHFDHGKE